MNRFFLIAGPCVIEDPETALQIGRTVKAHCDELGIRYIFKASYKKANRTRVDSFQGIGDEAGLRIIHGVGRELGVETLTDVHESGDPALAAKYVSHLQIPAFLCRQTDLLIAAGRTGCTVNIKKGQFLSPEAMGFAVEKVRSTGNEKIWLCERGTTFGYQDLIVDATSLVRLKKHGRPVVMDCTHSVQKPNQTSGITGGDPESISTMARFAAATGADGLFIEVHPEPGRAASDSQSMLQLDKLRPILQTAMRIRAAIRVS